MKAISPVLPSSKYWPEVIYAKDQPEYRQLPAVNITYSDGAESVISCYKLTLIERLQVLFSGRVWWEQLTFGQSLQPQKMYVSEPLKNYGG